MLLADTLPHLSTAERGVPAEGLLGQRAVDHCNEYGDLVGLRWFERLPIQIW